MSQVYNPNTNQFIKRDKDGKFTSSKDTPYKNIPLATGGSKMKVTTAKPINNKPKK